MKEITVIIADDESPARDEIRHILSATDSVKVVGEAKNGPEAVKLVEELRPDALFLDIEMPGFNGIEVAKRLLSKGIAPHIIFATAYDEYAIRAFEVNAVDYILKPFEEERVRQSLDRVLRLRGATDEGIKKIERLIAGLSGSRKKVMSKIPIKQKGKTALIDASKIVYSRAEGGLVFISDGDKEHLTDYSSLDALEKDLDPEDFYRSSRSYIVNLSRMQEIAPLGSGHYLIRCAGKGSEFVEIPLSRRQAKELRKRIKF